MAAGPISTTQPDPPEGRRSGRIQSVDRAAHIMRTLATGEPILGVTEIADRISLAKPTVYGLLRTLEFNGLVRQDPDTGKYSLGPGVLQLGNAYLAGSEFRAHSMLRSFSLAHQVGEAVWAGVLTDDDVVVVHHEFRPGDMVQILEVGATIPWHACALGQAIAAFVDGEVLASLWTSPRRALTGRTHTSRQALGRKLAKIRRDGYAVENQEANVGEGSIAAAVFDRRRQVVGSIALVGPIERLLDREALPGLARAVTDTAHAISRDLGGRLIAPVQDEA
jgi:DNA-binding IclR family transcriptional regulator